MTPRQGEAQPYKNADIVIQRGVQPKGAITHHFPCHLIEKNEELKVFTITKTYEEKLMLKPATSEDLVTFNIHTTGGKNITCKVLKNPNLRDKVNYVCVYAYKGETVKESLERDGRFADILFSRHCALEEIDNNPTVEMSSFVDNLNKRKFRVIDLGGGNDTEGKQSLTDTPVTAASTTAVKSEEHKSKHLIETPGQATSKVQEQSTDHTLKDVIDELLKKKLQISNPATHHLEPLLGEGYKSLCSQFNNVLGRLKKQKDVWSIFRQEYDKSQQSCSEVRVVKLLMELADNVCMIRINGTSNGTGFILFHLPPQNTQTSKKSFILTNAHVIMCVVDESGTKLHETVTTEFEYWENDMKKSFTRRVKKQLVSYKYSPANVLDFALLELEDDEERTLPDGLLIKCSLHPIRGGICLIGHPDGGDKKMDPSFIVEPQNQHNSVMTHIIKNKDLQPFMQEKCHKEKWNFNSKNITYNTCFFYGSSGSPVFTSTSNLIGIHSGGYAYQGHGGETKSIIEYAYPIKDILKCIITQSKERGRTDVSTYLESQSHIAEILETEQRGSLIQGLADDTFHALVNEESMETN